MSQFQRKVLAKSLKMIKAEPTDNQVATNGHSTSMTTEPALPPEEPADNQVATNGHSTSMTTEPALPPEMPKKLPKVVQLLVSRTPEVYKPAVAHAIFPSLGAHLWKVRFPYIDNVMHEATFMNVATHQPHHG